MENPKKVLSIALIGISCFTGFFIYYFLILPELSPSGGGGPDNGETGPSASVSHINLTVNYNNGTIDTFNNFSLENYKTTPFDAVKKWCALIYDVYPNGDYYVRYVNGRGVGWIYKVNGVKPGYACNYHYLVNGDVVEWDYTG